MVIGDKEDNVIWLETNGGIFLVKSLYTILEFGRSLSFPVGVVWNVWVPLKACFFAWEASSGKA